MILGAGGALEVDRRNAKADVPGRRWMTISGTPSRRPSWPGGRWPSTGDSVRSQAGEALGRAPQRLAVAVDAGPAVAARGQPLRDVAHGERVGAQRRVVELLPPQR